MHAPVVALFGEMLADVFPDRSVLGGAPFNVARHLQARGLRPVMISRIGTDTLGKALLDEMTQRGMSLDGMQHDAVHPTGQVQVTLTQHHHHFDILPDQAYDFICATTTRATLTHIPPQLAYFGTLAQRNPVSHQAAQAFLQTCHCPVFLDINLRTPWFNRDTIAASLAAANIVKLNDEELSTVAAALGLATPHAESQAKALQQQFNLDQVLVTCGEAGCWLLDAQQRFWKAAPRPDLRPIMDTVGAGDAFAAVFMQGLLHGEALPTTLQRACDEASAQCRVRGAAPPNTI